MLVPVQSDVASIFIGNLGRNVMVRLNFPNRELKHFTYFRPAKKERRIFNIFCQMGKLLKQTELKNKSQILRTKLCRPIELKTGF
jgi:hypothetical protein